MTRNNLQVHNQISFLLLVFLRVFLKFVMFVFAIKLAATINITKNVCLARTLPGVHFWRICMWKGRVG